MTSAPEKPVPIRRALLSASDKTGLVGLGRALVDAGAALLSTGGTAAALRAAGLAVTDIADDTGFPEILDGRVKTLLPRIHGGLLGKRDRPAHLAEMAAHDIPPIDLVAVTLYPFEAAAAAPGLADEAVIEQIDIGGPALIRAGAKNHADVTVLTDPADYDAVIAEIATLGGTSAALRRRLAASAFGRTAAYEAAIAAWFAGRAGGERLPDRLTIAARRVAPLRYGENPHQQAAFYAAGRPAGVVAARQVQGRALSYNNIADADAALDALSPHPGPTVVIVKHANPCGVATAGDLATAWERALRTDPVSAFGGIVAVNRPLDLAAAERMASLFLEVIVAPAADEAALARLARRPSLRVLLGGVDDRDSDALLMRSVGGGLLVQTADRVEAADWRAVTSRRPTDVEETDLRFAMRVATHVKSNAIVLARHGATVGIDAAHLSGADAAAIAIAKARDATVAAGLEHPLAAGAVAASDAFFPFADGLDRLIEAGVTAVVQPGGSMRDEEVIAAADRAGIAMVFTGTRHFRH